MSRLSGPKRRKLYELLARRDGERCFVGGERGNFWTLLIDHADNDNQNNDPVNLHLMCRSINGAKNPRGFGRKKKQSSSVYVCVSEEDYSEALEPVRTTSAELKKNEQAEPDFRHWLFIEIWRKGRLPLEEVIDCGAAVAGCSQETIKRYLRKESSRVRLYQILEEPETGRKYVQFRPEWEKHRKKEEGRRTLDRQARNWREDTIRDAFLVEDGHMAQGNRRTAVNPAVLSTTRAGVT